MTVSSGVLVYLYFSWMIASVESNKTRANSFCAKVCECCRSSSLDSVTSFTSMSFWLGNREGKVQPSTATHASTTAPLTLHPFEKLNLQLLHLSPDKSTVKSPYSPRSLRQTKNLNDQQTRLHLFASINYVGASPPTEKASPNALDEPFKLLTIVSADDIQMFKRTDRFNGIFAMNGVYDVISCNGFEEAKRSMEQNEWALDAVIIGPSVVQSGIDWCQFVAWIRGWELENEAVPVPIGLYAWHFNRYLDNILHNNMDPQLLTPFVYVKLHENGTIASSEEI
eukprot:193575_1